MLPKFNLRPHPTKPIPSSFAEFLRSVWRLTGGGELQLPSSSNRDLSRDIRVLGGAWAVALALAIVLLLAGESIRSRTLRGMAADASVINQAGRQRTRSQLIASKAGAVVLSRNDGSSVQGDSLTAELSGVTEEFVRGHLALLHRDAKGGLAGKNSEPVRKRYKSLQPHYDTLRLGVRDLLDSYNETPTQVSDQRRIVAALQTAAANFLPLMDAIVHDYEVESEARLARLRYISWTLTVATIVILGAVFVGLVRPILRQSLAQALITEKALLNAKRASQKASRLAAFARHSTNAMIRTDAQRRITWVNDGFTRVTGYTLEECRGKSPGALLQCEKSDPEVVRRMGVALRKGEGFHGRILNRSKSGRDYWLDLEIIPELDDDGNVSGFISIESDVTELVAAREQADKAKDEANAANRAKSEFLANMSHEIRTPMTAILGYTDLLAGEFAGDLDRSAEGLQIVQSNANHLLTIINDILDVSKLEAGQLNVETIDTSPAQIVEEVASLSRPQAIHKQIDFDVEYDTPIPKRIQSDPTRLRQILLNLTSNAIKFTEAGGVLVRVAYHAGTEQLQLRVEDSGVGLKPEKLAAIAEFTAFQQADTSTARRFGGTGLGLYISNALAKRLGGRLEVESVFGEGSAFTVWVSAKTSENVAMWVPGMVPGEQAKLKNDNTESQSNVSLAGVQILLAEDGPDNQRLIAHHLQKAGASVDICGNGRQAVDRILESERGVLPDIVLMDMQMPELDGYQATRLLRRKGTTVPIIALTAHAMEGDRRKCLHAGCDDYITKPIDKNVLLSTCAKFAASLQR